MTMRIKMDNEKKTNWITAIVLVISFAMIGFGIARGEPNVVLTKAINICLQCIGIG